MGISERIAQKTVSAQLSYFFRDIHILDESRKSYLISKSVIFAARGTSKMKQSEKWPIDRLIRCSLLQQEIHSSYRIKQEGSTS